MVTSPAQRQRRIGTLKARIAQPQDALMRCQVYPCANPTTAHQREGLNRLYCRRHVEHFRRHGSFVKKSYGAGELRPYCVEAMRWLKANQGHPAVQAAIDWVHRRFVFSGPPVEAYNLAGKPPKDRARAAWAQLARRKVDPLAIVAAWLAVDWRLRDDPQPDRHQEYREVQVAKLVHRMAGGTHKRWERECGDGGVEVTELHRHPVSRGLVLRVIGRELSGACGGLRDVVARGEAQA